ncbi:maleylacetate reductase [Streptomyces sp. NPDC088387]|uniref:maleylacetate reductase n=1 Tax=Streptomyces sp. NPDC088387 TaxID=3365859 RepID=UPI0038129570
MNAARPAPFTQDDLPGRVVYGRGAAHNELAAELARLGVRRVMLVATPGGMPLAQHLTLSLKDLVVCAFDGVRPHVPYETVVEARLLAEQYENDAVLCVGGGSAVGTAKMMALTRRVPVVAVPTTYSGSEVTPIWGTTISGAKRTGRDVHVRPQVVVYDPELLKTLPAPFAMASGLNAVAHCVESLWLSDAPAVRLFAAEGVAALARGLRTLATGEDGSDHLLYGAYLAGTAFAAAGSGLHHLICHVLGGAFNLPHAETHAAVLPHVLAFNATAVQDRLAVLADALKADHPVTGLSRLYEDIAAPRSLAALGLTAQQIPRAIELVQASPPVRNPRPVEPDQVRAIITAAHEGRGYR